MAKKSKSKSEKQAELNSSTTEQNEMKILNSTDVKQYTDEFLQSEQERYNKLADDFGNTLKSKQYSVKVDDIKDAKSLLKHLEKNVKWTHAEAPLFIASYQKLKESIAKGLNEQGCLEMLGSSINGIYQLLIKTEGVGYFEVRDYMSLLANIGQGITDAMTALVEDQNQLRNIHTNLSVLDDESVARKMGIEVEELSEQNS
jgi:hypothetical protein